MHVVVVMVWIEVDWKNEKRLGEFLMGGYCGLGFGRDGTYDNPQHSFLW